MGGGDLVNHMKNIHEVKDHQPLSFSHVHCRGVAARAGSVDLIYSMDRKLGWGQNTPTTAPSCWGPFSKKFQPTTGWKSTMPIVQHSTKRHTTSMTFHHTHHNNTTHFLHGWSKSTSTTLTASPSARLGSSTSSARLMEGAWQKIKGHAERGRAHSH